MGIFNEQSSDYPFARGIQGAPGVGFSLTVDGNYDINKKRLTNVGAPSDNTDAATKKYVDDNSSGSATTSRLTVDSNIDMKDTYRILNLKHPSDAEEPATKQYVDSKFLDRAGDRGMIENLDMNNHKIVELGTPTSNTDAATKKYVDDNGVGNITADIDLTNSYNIKNSKTRTFNQLKAAPESLVSYEEVKENFIGINEAEAMKTDLDMGNNLVYNVKTPTANDQAANKSYVDTKVSNSMLAAATKQELGGYLKKDGSVAMTGDFNTAGHKILNLRTPASNSEPTTKYYTDNNFLKLDGTKKMTGNLDMNNKQINNIPAPTGPKQPTPLVFTDLKYLARDGTNTMTNNLNMDNKGIVNLKPPTSNSDAATKKYVDDNTGAPDLSDYLEKDGTVAMTGDLNVGDNLIKNVSFPHQKNDATNKEYVDQQINRIASHPDHYRDVFAYLMSSGTQWTDEITTRTSFTLDKIDDLAPSSGNFHNYNHKVIYLTLIKYIGFESAATRYRFKMGMNFYRLKGNTNYTLCLELLNTNQTLWNKTQISIDKGTSIGLTIENDKITKHTHSFTNSNGQTKTMYYHRIIVNFKKLSSGNKFFLHLLVNIPLNGLLISNFPNRFSGVYLIAYGVEGTVSNIDPDKVYDYHTAFDIKPTEVVYNVDINANQKKIKNIKLDQSSDNNVATIGLLKSLIPHIYNNLYREIFEEYYDFSDASIYGVRHLSSGAIINSFKPNITIPNKDLSIIKKDSINVNGYNLTFTPSNHTSQYSLCIVFDHDRFKSFSLSKIRRSDNTTLTTLYYVVPTHKIHLAVNNINDSFTVLSEFDKKRIVLFLTESFSSNITKFKMSNYSATLSVAAVLYSNDQYWKFTIGDGKLYRIMSSPNFYDFDSDEYHKLMIQEKLNGSYIS